MKKRAIVLLITLFFITAISIVIFKNLKDTDSFIDQLSFDADLIQIDMINKNIKEEVIKFTNNNFDATSIDTLLEFTEYGIPFEFGNNQILLTLNKYDPQKYCDIHTLAKLNKDSIDSSRFTNQCDDNVTQNVLNHYEFLKKLVEYEYKYDHKIETKAQLEYMIDEYSQETLDQEIYTVIDNFGYHELNSTGPYIDCTYEVVLDGIVLDGEFIFELEKEETKFSDFNLRLP
jgi:hypothetical protein